MAKIKKEKKTRFENQIMISSLLQLLLELAFVRLMLL
jgi:hypothetical protein